MICHINIGQGCSPGINLVKLFKLALARKLFAVFFQQGFNKFNCEFHHVQ